MKQFCLAMSSAVAFLLFLSVGCSTTQKAAGGGFTSAIAQNVVRIACVQAVRDADFSMVEGRMYI